MKSAFIILFIISTFTIPQQAFSYSQEEVTKNMTEKKKLCQLNDDIVTGYETTNINQIFGDEGVVNFTNHKIIIPASKDCTIENIKIGGLTCQLCRGPGNPIHRPTIFQGKSKFKNINFSNQLAFENEVCKEKIITYKTLPSVSCLGLGERQSRVNILQTQIDALNFIDKKLQPKIDALKTALAVSQKAFDEKKIIDTLEQTKLIKQYIGNILAEVNSIETQANKKTNEYTPQKSIFPSLSEIFFRSNTPRYDIPEKIKFHSFQVDPNKNPVWRSETTFLAELAKMHESLDSCVTNGDGARMMATNNQEIKTCLEKREALNQVHFILSPEGSLDKSQNTLKCDSLLQSDDGLKIGILNKPNGKQGMLLPIETIEVECSRVQFNNGSLPRDRSRSKTRVR